MFGFVKYCKSTLGSVKYGSNMFGFMKCRNPFHIVKLGYCEVLHLEKMKYCKMLQVQ